MLALVFVYAGLAVRVFKKFEINYMHIFQFDSKFTLGET